MILTLRKRPIIVSAVALSLAMTVSACDPNRRGGGISKQTIGGGLGAAAGVALGSAIGSGGGRTAAMIVGGLVGAVVGSELGRSMDEQDRLYAQQTEQQAFETGASGRDYSWRNPDSGPSGTVRPNKAYYDDGGVPCRDFTQTINIDGRSETAAGVACRNPDGTWRIVNS